MCDKVVNTYHSTIEFVPDCDRAVTADRDRAAIYVTELLINVFWDLLVIFLIETKLKKFMAELILKIVLCCCITLINIKLNECAMKLFMIIWKH